MTWPIRFVVSGCSRSDNWRKLRLALRGEGISDATFLLIKEVVKGFTRWGKLLLVLDQEEPSDFEFDHIESLYLGVVTVTFAYNYAPWRYEDRLCVVVVN